VVQHIHTSAMPVEKLHRTWWMVHVDTAGWSMSNLCRISVANFAKQKWRLFDILPAIEQLLRFTFLFGGSQPAPAGEVLRVPVFES
jgi:hypothetical protein